jgi:hypothetical protein
VKKNMPCDYDWSTSVEMGELDHHGTMEGALQGNHSEDLRGQSLSPAEAPIEPATDGTFGLNAPTGPRRPSDGGIVASQLTPSITSGPDNDVHGVSFDLDMCGLQTHGLDTGFTEATLTYADFLKDLLNWEGPRDGVQRPGAGDGQGSTNIWDQHLNIDVTFDELLDLPMPDIISPVQEAARPAPTGGLNGSGTGRKMAGQTPFEERAFVAGARAFEGSWLNWSPDRMHQPSLDQDEASLGLPHDWSKDNDSLRRDPSLTQQPLTITDRHRVLSTLLLFSDKRSLIRIATTFPGTQELESMLHGFLRHQLVDPFSWFHVPTFSLPHLRDELLAALVAFGASLTRVEMLQKLGHAMADILRPVVIEQVLSYFYPVEYTVQQTRLTVS